MVVRFFYVEAKMNFSREIAIVIEFNNEQSDVLEVVLSIV